MVEPDKVNRIWAALHNAKCDLFEEGERRMSTAMIVDFVAERAAAALGDDAGITREEVLEAWLYQALGDLARASGLGPLPPAN
jgi:hypothetical protein